MRKGPVEPSQEEPPDRLGYLRDNGVSEGAGSLAGKSDVCPDSISVHPGGNPIIHST